MKNAKIAIILPSLALGGVEKVMVNLANVFIQREHEVHMVINNSNDSVFIDQLASQVRLYNLGASRVLKSLFPLIQYLKNETPDLLLVGQNHMNILTIWAKILSRVKSKVFLTLHSHISRSNAEDCIPWLAKRTYPLADGLIAVSKGVAEDHSELLGLPRNMIQVLYNPAITPAIFAQAKQPIAASLAEWLHKPFIVSVGRLSPEKNFVTLLKSFRDAKESIPHNLIILGEGPMRGQLEEMLDAYNLRQRVLLPGYVANPYAVIAGADLLVSSSKWEGLPTVLIEAVALGTKVVATNCAGSREVLQDGKLGVLVPVDNELALSQAIVNVVTGTLEVSYADTDALSLYWHETAADNYLQYLSEKLR